MNGLSAGELCCLFCCPPCPSQIVAKLAFLPPPPTYKLIISGDQTVYSHSVNNSPEQNNPTDHQAINLSVPASTVNNRSLNNRDNGIMQMLRNSGRLFCRSIVCSQRYQAQQQAQQSGQLLQQLHTNAKIVMLDRAEWQVAVSFKIMH